MDRLETPLPGSPALVPPFRIEGWDVEPSLNRVTAGEHAHQLEPRLIHVLACLASRPGKVISRAELMKTVWGDVIVGDDSLTVTISELRRILGDDVKAPRFIETIRKTGYRLVATVTPPEDSGQTLAPAETGDGSQGIRTGIPGYAIGIVLLLIIISAAMLVRQLTHPGETSQPSFLHGVPFTSYPGSEIYPALSPDGIKVAFVWEGKEGRNLDIYVKQRNTESSLRLTDHPDPELFPAWSPDGSTIAFVRLGKQSGIFTVSAMGGPVRQLAQVEPDVNGLDWSPDGKWLALAMAARVEDPYRIVLLSLETLEVRNLSLPTSQFTCNSWPAFSPDGLSIAFMRAGLGLQRDICLIATAGGEPRLLASGQRQVMGLDWALDGQEIIFAAAPTGNFSLWRVSIEDGALAWMPTPGHEAMYPTTATSENRLVYQELSHDSNIWSVSLSEPPGSAPSVKPLIVSTRVDFGANISPNGDRIAFTSMRSGALEIWICDRDGRNPRQVTAFNGEYVLDPRWSPDGGQLAFTASQEGHMAIYVVDVDAAAPRRLTAAGHHEISPRWSSDGTWIYLSRKLGDTWQIWKTDLNGREQTLVIDASLRPLYETRDGRCLYYRRYDDQGIWKMTLESGAQQCLVNSDRAADWQDLVVVEDGIYFIQRTSVAGVFSFLDFTTGESDSLFPLDVMGAPNLAVSPDGSYILYDRSDRFEHDLILVEGFR